MDRSQNLFSMDWMELFDLFNISIKPFCNNVDGSSNNTKKLKRECKSNFPEFFSNGLGFCTKIKAKFELKEDAAPIFWLKRQVLFAALVNIDKELERLEKFGVIKKKIIVPGQAQLYT